MPVLPAVPSTSVPPGFSSPRRSKSSRMPRAARSLDRTAGVQELGLAEDLAAGGVAEAVEADERVWPMASEKDWRMVMGGS